MALHTLDELIRPAMVTQALIDRANGDHRHDLPEAPCKPGGWLLLSEMIEASTPIKRINILQHPALTDPWIGYGIGNGIVFVAKETWLKLSVHDVKFTEDICKRVKILCAVCEGWDYQKEAGDE